MSLGIILELIEAILKGLLFIFPGIIFKNHWGLLMESITGNIVRREIWLSNKYQQALTLIRYIGITMIGLGIITIISGFYKFTLYQ